MKKITFDQLPYYVYLMGQKLNNVERLLLEKSKQQSENQPERLLTVKQAANFLSLAVPTIYSKCSKGELPYMKKGKRLYFSQDELNDYVKSGRVKTNKEIEESADDYLNSKK